MRATRMFACFALLSSGLGLAACTDDQTSEPPAVTAGGPAAEPEAAEEESANAEKAALAAAATVSIEQAVKAATAKQPGKVIEAELDRDQGRVLWELEIVATDGSIAELAVDAGTGAIVED